MYLNHTAVGVLTPSSSLLLDLNGYPSPEFSRRLSERAANRFAVDQALEQAAAQGLPGRQVRVMRGLSRRRFARWESVAERGAA